MKYYLVITDTNSRQYPIEIKESGLGISAQNVEPFIITPNDVQLDSLSRLYGKVVFGKTLVIDFMHVTAIQFQEHPDDVV